MVNHSIVPHVLRWLNVGSCFGLLILVWSNTAGGCHSRYWIAPSRTTIHTGWFSSRQGHRARLITGFNGSKSKQTSVSHGLVHISSSNHWQESGCMVEAVKGQTLEKRILELSLFHQWKLDMLHNVTWLHQIKIQISSCCLFQGWRVCWNDNLEWLGVKHLLVADNTQCH